MSSESFLKINVINGMADAIGLSAEAMMHAGEHLEFLPTSGGEALVATLEPYELTTGALLRLFVSDGNGGTVGTALVSALMTPGHNASSRDICRAAITTAAYILVSRIPFRDRLTLSILDKADRVAELRVEGKDTEQYVKARQDLVSAVDALSARV